MWLLISWSPTILYRQPYFAGFVGMENCIFSLCLDVRNFLKLLKKTCLHKGGFQDFFDIHFSLWTFGGSTVKFFSGSQRASHLCSPEKNFTVSPPNVRREKFMSKKSWKPPLCRRVFFNASRNFYIRGKREEQAIPGSPALTGPFKKKINWKTWVRLSSKSEMTLPGSL